MEIHYVQNKQQRKRRGHVSSGHGRIGCAHRSLDSQGGEESGKHGHLSLLTGVRLPLSVMPHWCDDAGTSENILAVRATPAASTTTASWCANTPHHDN
jgi:hypothetical protein